jgi:starch synthase
VPDEKIRVITYGAPEVKPRAQRNLDATRPLKVLFVGNLGQHKGIGYLLKAMDMLGGRAELTLVGRRLHPNPKVDEACRRWRWHENLPHAQVLDAMQQADVLVLPSLSEGCALVVLEALACGLPVVVTPNTGSLAFVRDGREGFVVPICQAEAIAERLEVLHQDRELLSEMSRWAQATAAENSWENYRADLAGLVRSLAWD